MLKAIVLIGLLAFTPALARSQTIRGIVVEDGTDNRVSEVTVELVDARGRTAATVLTDSSGGFILIPRRAGEFTVRAAHPSYVTVVTQSLSTKGGEAVEILVRLGRTAIPLDPLLVQARTSSRLSGFYERSARPGGFGRFITREEIDARPGATNATDLLRGVPAIELVTFDPVSRRSLVSIRSGAPPRGAVTADEGGTLILCEPSIYIDGMPFRQVAYSTVDDILRADMIEGVEIYTRGSGAPPEFVQPGKCGVIAFWSRPSSESGARWSWAKLLAGTAAFTVLVLLTR